MRNVIKDLNNSSMKNVDEHIELERFPDGFRDDKKKFVLIMGFRLEIERGSSTLTGFCRG